MTMKSSVVRELSTLIDYFVILPLISSLPPRMARRWAGFRGDLLFLGRRQAWAQALCNVAQALGNPSQEQVVSIVRKHFQCLSYEEMFTYWLERELSFLLSLVTISGLEELKAAQAQGRGVIIATGHIGCVALLFTLLGRLGFHPYLVFQDPAELTTQSDSWKRYARARISRLERQVVRPILYTKRGHYPRMKTILRRGECLLLGFDIVPSLVERTVEVEFFGQPSVFPYGIASLYRQTGARVVLSWIQPQEDGSHNLEFKDITSVLEAANDRREVMQLLVNQLEGQIRQHPAAWQLWDSWNLFLV